MARWSADLTEQQLAKISAKNRASHIRGPASQVTQRGEAAPKGGKSPVGASEAIRRYMGAKNTSPSAPTPRGKRTSGPSKMREAHVLAACQSILEAHPAVALWWRQNTGAVKFQDSRYVKFSFRGAPDLMGILKGGRFFCVECKATGKAPNAAQQAFMDNVTGAGGLSIWTDDPARLPGLLSRTSQP